MVEQRCKAVEYNSSWIRCVSIVLGNEFIIINIKTVLRISVNATFNNIIYSLHRMLFYLYYELLFVILYVILRNSLILYQV